MAMIGMCAGGSCSRAHILPAVFLTCVAFAWLQPVVASGSIKLERASIRLSYLSQQERLTRRAASAEAPDFAAIGAPYVTAEVDDTLLVQASCVDAATSETAHAQQAFLRFVRKDTGLDSVYVMKKKGFESRLELSLKKEIRADHSFWTREATYRVEVVVGDTRMDSGVSWVAIDALSFGNGPPGPFGVASSGVFDFDVGVKRSVLPEFSSKRPPEEKQAPFIAVVLALFALLGPFPLVFVAWGRLGVFPFKMPEGAQEKSSVVGFELCLLGHMFALTMFWLKWNIVFTWKVMAAIMVPTLFFGHRVLSTSASLQARKGAMAGTKNE